VLTPGLLPTTNLYLVPADSIADVLNFIATARKLQVYIFNLSQGFRPNTPPSVVTDFHRSVRDLWQDSLFVVAAGNAKGGNEDLNSGGASAPVVWAAALPNVMAVAAADSRGTNVLGKHTEFGDTLENPDGTQYGSMYVDLVAPGESLCSLGKVGYAHASGSSQAAPQVAATAAMLWTHVRNPAALRARLMYTSDWSSLYAEKAWAGMLHVQRAIFAPLSNVLITQSEAERHEIVLQGSVQVQVNGIEFKRNGTKVGFSELVSFGRILRMQDIGAPRYRLFLLRSDDSMAIVEGTVSGKVPCKSLTHYNAANRAFGDKPHPKADCVVGIDTNQIKEYVAATPGQVRLP